MLLVALIALTANIGTAQAKKPATFATLNQWANTEIKNGGIYGRGWGQASPKLKFIVTQMIFIKFGDNWVGRKMLCYAHRESGLNPMALSRTNDHHVFQLNYSAHNGSFDFTRLDKPDVGYGITSAWRLYRGAGFTPWAGGSHSC